jgi:Mycothiol maleylpyruvate isomerase N-terminal domain
MADLVDDLDATVAAATAALLEVVHRDWDIPAPGLTWTCRGTVEHVADDLFAYAGQIATSKPEVDTYVAFDFYADREGEPKCAVHAKRDRGNAGLVQILDACGGMLSALARTRPADVRGWHTSGVSDPHGFAAMGTVEVLLHLYDVAEPLGLEWDPHPDVVRRVLGRLFPSAPSDGDPWQTLLQVTGRDPDKPVDSWQWDGTVREST